MQCTCTPQNEDGEREGGRERESRGEREEVRREGGREGERKQRRERGGGGGGEKGGRKREKGREEREREYLSWGVDVIPAEVCSEWEHRLIIQEDTKRTLSCI